MNYYRAVLVYSFSYKLLKGGDFRPVSSETTM